MVTQHQLQRIIQKQKGVKVQKMFPKYGGKYYLHNFCVSGDVTGYINIHNPHLFTFGNTKFQYMSATTQVAAKENQWAKP